MLGPAEHTPETRRLRFWQRVFAAFVRAFARFELWFDQVFWSLRRRFGRLGPLQIVAYRGYGTLERTHVRGRVLEASVLERSLPNDSRWRNIRRMLRRFNSKEVPEAMVTASFGERCVSGQTDDEGYFDLLLTPEPAPASQRPGAAGNWSAASVEITGVPVRGFVPARSSADIMIPGPDVERGIISDIDDTVLQTHVTQKLKMIWVTLSGSPYTRMPFEGTSALYHALVDGASGRAQNPVFYVSKSPWNLYDFLVDFMDHHALPRGPFLLRDIGLREAPPIDHKTDAVGRLLETYPELPFVLIGDSGERDPDIYLATAAAYPGRILAIYIRDLGGKHGSAGRAADACARAKELGTEMLWVEHASEALEHARQRGLARAASEAGASSLR
jgi:phosphatidate phosphatase APP1